MLRTNDGLVVMVSGRRGDALAVKVTGLLSHRIITSRSHNCGSGLVVVMLYLD